MASGSRDDQTPPTGDPHLAELVANVLATRKYAHISPTLVHSIAAQALQNAKTPKRALKATKAKLHQVGAAYFCRSPQYDRWLHALADASQSADPDQRKAACREIMAAHASTRERLPILDTFYETLLADLPPIHSVIDLACGLNPLAIPWMPLSLSTTYRALDIYSDLSNFMSSALPLLGVAGSGGVMDLTQQLPREPADVALLLKALPCLDQLAANLSRRLITGIPARVIILSYPVASLGGRGKGMIASYSRHFAALDIAAHWDVDTFHFDTELVYRLRARERLIDPPDH